jgi:hypothetical protein
VGGRDFDDSVKPAIIQGTIPIPCAMLNGIDVAVMLSEAGRRANQGPGGVLEGRESRGVTG